jgi:hypothetical protein
MSEDRLHQCSKLLRNTDEWVMSFFKDLKVFDEKGAHTVPCLWCNEEKAASVICVDELPPSLKPDNIRLPLVTVYSNHINVWDGVANDPTVHYQVNIYSLFHEDMNQLLEQVIFKAVKNKDFYITGIDRNIESGVASPLKVVKSKVHLFTSLKEQTEQ